MKALKVNVYLEKIEEIALRKDDVKDLARHIGCEYVDCVHDSGLDFWIDDEGLLQEPQAPCFFLKGYGKLTGNAVVLGFDINTCESTEPPVTAEELARRVRFGGFQPSVPFMAFILE